jgi:hypothetical protein
MTHTPTVPTGQHSQRRVVNGLPSAPAIYAGEPGDHTPGMGEPGGRPGDDAPASTPGTGENICPDCNGSGQRDSRECPTCGGTGKVIEGIGGG